MNRRAGAWIALVLVLQSVASSTPAFAQATKPPPAAAKPAAPVDLIARGRALFEDQQYEESIQVLSAALVRPGSTKEQRIETHRLLALNFITLGRKEEAESAVRGLLVLAPETQLPATESPRFRDFFAETKRKWEAEGRPGLLQEDAQPKAVSLKHGSPSESEAHKNIELHARLEDPEGRTGAVRFYYRPGSKGAYSQRLADVEGSSVRATIPGADVKPPVVDYYFEILDGAGNVIATRGDASAPLRIAVSEASRGWVLPVAIGGGILAAAAVVGGLALAGVFNSSSPPGRGNSTVSVNVGESSWR